MTLLTIHDDPPNVINAEPFPYTVLVHFKVRFPGGITHGLHVTQHVPHATGLQLQSHPPTANMSPIGRTALRCARLRAILVHFASSDDDERGRVGIGLGDGRVDDRDERGRVGIGEGSGDHASGAAALEKPVEAVLEQPPVGYVLE